MNPKGCTKKSLLDCVSVINKTCKLKPQLQVKTKTLEVILTSTFVALQNTNHFQIIEDTPQETLNELVLWGILDIGFLGEEVPEETKTILESFTSKTIQSEDTLAFDADQFPAKEEEEKTTPPMSNALTSEEKMEAREDLVDLIQVLTKKHSKAVKKGKEKKIKKILALLDDAKEQLMAMNSPSHEEEEKTPPPPPKKKKEKEVNPRIQEIQALIQVLNDSMPEKKKKAKKQQAQIDELATELAELITKPATNKPKTVIKRGVSARANRPLPTKISWPRANTVTAAIIKATSKKHTTVDDVIKKVAKKFPERQVSGLTKTIQALIGGRGLPLPLHYTKGVVFEVENDGTPERTVLCTSTLPEDY